MRTVLARLLTAKKARRARRHQAGMTLLEIMIVLAILALVMGILIGPRVMSMFSDSKVDTAKIAVKNLSAQAYAFWSKSNPSKSCPDSVEQLGEEIDMKADKEKKQLLDAWGNRYVMMCGQSLPPGVRGLAILSLGPDGKQGTDDDIRSWD